MSRPVILFGSSGSIGRSTLSVIRRHRERFRLCALAVGGNVDELCRQVEEFAPQSVCLHSPESARRMRERFPRLAVFSGTEGLSELVDRHAGACLVAASSGTGALRATVEALRRGMRVCLANKETLVAAGELINRELDAGGAEILPIDSEQSAIFQCLNGHRRDALHRIILTASGGPFRDCSASELASVTVERALAHPTWSMGRKITIDSATLMNKGLEMIEALHLFRLRPEQISALIHPQSVVHSLVEYIDTSLIAQLSLPDMCVPILYSLSYPERLSAPVPPLDLAAQKRLEFRAIDEHRFPAIPLARQVMRAGGSAGAVFNAANEVAVDHFLRGRISFPAIVSTVARIMESEPIRPLETLDDVLETICRTERRTAETIEREVTR
jgi:1-deoxy-D-xylulose-5-phosphate reductoisomerase